MKWWQGILIAILGIVLLTGIGWGLGWNRVFYTKTVGAAQQNADREVFEESQSYVEGKRQEALKYYKEYKQADNSSDKEVIKELVSHSFANFDENKLSPRLADFVRLCKYDN